jgi:hypothetical protein
VIANVGSNLLETPGCDKRRDRIRHRPQSIHGETGRKARHVGFRYAAIEKSVLVAVFEVVEKTIADVARQHDDAMILISELG